MTNRVFVTGLGTVNCLGTSAEHLWESSRNDLSGIHQGLGHVSDDMIANMRQRTLASPFRSLFEPLWTTSQPNKALLMPAYALSEALTSSDGPHHFRDDDGLIIATTTGQITVWDQALVRYLNKEISGKDFEGVFEHQPLGSLLDGLKHLYAFSGPNLLVTSACSAATQAIAIASQWVSEGRVKRCFVGGTEILCDLTIEGFKCLQLLSEERALPFDEHRSGINLSEGAAFLCLTLEPGPKALACVSGFGLSGDGYHMTAPHPEGLGSQRAMRAALHSAGLKPEDISWVHAHGTGSKHNDLSEANAIAGVFGEKMPYVSSTKWVHGHALGASGAIESILCIKALNEQTILRTGGLKTPDPLINLKHAERHLVTKVDHILKNTLGFGGVNASLVFSKV